MVKSLGLALRTRPAGSQFGVRRPAEGHLFLLILAPVTNGLAQDRVPGLSGPIHTCVQPAAFHRIHPGGMGHGLRLEAVVLEHSVYPAPPRPEAKTINMDFLTRT